MYKPAETAWVDYLKDAKRYQMQKPYILSLDIAVECEDERSNLEHEKREIKIQSLRQPDIAVSLSSHRFELFQIDQTRMDDFFTSSGPARELAGVTEILRQRFSTPHVFCYDHAVSSGFFGDMNAG